MAGIERETFAAHLRTLRRDAGLSQAIAARHAKVSEGTWRRWEQGGMPQIWRAQAIAAALGKSLPELLAPDADRVHVATVQVDRDALARIRAQGEPELDRLANDLTATITARLRTLAATTPPKAKRQPPNSLRPRAYETRARLALTAANRGNKEQGV